MQNHPDGDSRNFAWVSRILGTLHAALLLASNYWNTTVYTPWLSFPTKKLTPKCTYAAFASHRLRQYVGVHALVLIYSAWVKHYPITLSGSGKGISRTTHVLGDSRDPCVPRDSRDPCAPRDSRDLCSQGLKGPLCYQGLKGSLCSQGLKGPLCSQGLKDL